MRDQNGLLNTFLPLHEKEWDARLFIDDAIKDHAEYYLQVIARALSGRHNIRLSYCDPQKPFEMAEHIESDKGEWITKTGKYLIEARMDSFVFYGNHITQIWIKIIDFWIGKKMVWPCGGASFPNKKMEITYVDSDSKK